MGVENHFPFHTWGLLSLDKTKFNGKMSTAYLYVIVGWNTGWLITLCNKYNRIKLICFTKTTHYLEWMNVKDTLAIEIKNIVEKNKASFAFPSTSVYVEKNA